MNQAVRQRVLVVDDDQLIIDTIKERLEVEGFEVLQANEGQQGVERFRQGVDVVLLDFSLPDIGGQEVFRRLRMADPTVPVIMMTAHSSVTGAVSMMKEGLFHYTAKGTGYLNELVKEVRQATRGRRRGKGPRRPPSMADLVGPSPEMAHLRRELSRLVGLDDPVLIVGETGTGKRLLAEVLHHTGPRANAPLGLYNCAAVPSAQLELELFGQDIPGGEHDSGIPGALERAAGGTVVLGQVAELSSALQSKLLHFLETGRFSRRDGTREYKADVRIVATSPRSLRQDVDERGFSSNLCLALGGHRPLEVPALRERSSDVPHLARHYLTRYRTLLGRRVETLSADALTFLERQAWPGNVRELKNLMERAVLLAGEKHELTEADLMQLGEQQALHGFVLPGDGLDLAELEQSLVKQALLRTGGNRTRAGVLLGLNRDQVRYRIQKFKLESDEVGGDDEDASEER
jgi:two-component system response regulator AtoC